MSGFIGVGIGPYAIGRSGAPADPVPVAGAELLTNGDFSAWTGDNPNGWGIVGESGSDPMVTQAASGARFYSSGTYVDISQNRLTTNAWIRVNASIHAVVAGAVRIAIGTSNVSYTGAGTQIYTERANNSVLTIARHVAAAANDFTISSVSAVPLTLSSLLSTRTYTSADCDLSAAITRTAGTQAGFVARLDSSSSPANFIIAYLDGASNVKVDKCVAGTYTNVISGAITYGSTKRLRLVCSGTSVSAYYDGTQVGSTVTVSDAGIVSNVRHGKFSTYASNTFTGYVAA